MGCNESSCFSEDTIVWMADGTKKPISKVVAGEYVLTSKAGQRTIPMPARVTCITKSTGGFPVYRVAPGLGLTPRHPYWCPLSRRYEHPVSDMTYRSKTVYNLVLSNRQDLKVGSGPDPMYAVTLGHGIEDGVAGHTFYGTEMVVWNLMIIDAKGWASGLIDLTKCTLQRDRNGVCNIVKTLSYIYRT